VQSPWQSHAIDGRHELHVAMREGLVFPLLRLMMYQVVMGRDEIGASALRRYLSARMDSSRDLILTSIARSA
jgi:hypothetical protein